MKMTGDFSVDAYYASTPRWNFDELPRMVPARREMEMGAKRSRDRGVKLMAKSGEGVTESNLVSGRREFTSSYVNACVTSACE